MGCSYLSLPFALQLLVSGVHDSTAGHYRPLQTFGTPRTGGYGLEAFTIDGHTFLALAEFFGNQSTIYRWNGTDFATHQTIPSHAGHAFRHFVVDSQDFLALANYRTGFPPGDPQGWPQGPWFVPAQPTNSTIWLYNASTQRFDLFQSLVTSFANAWSAFSIRGRSYLAVANADSLAAVDRAHKYTGDTNSTVYLYNPKAAEFQVVQHINTHSALDIESFSIGNDTYLAIANTESKEAGFLVKSPVFRWSEQHERFEPFQLLNTTAANGITFFTIPKVRGGGGDFLAVANRWGKSGHRENSMIYRWQPQRKKFVAFQLVPTKGAYDWEFWEQHQQYLLAVANHWDEKAPDPKHPIAINSTIYRCENAGLMFRSSFHTTVIHRDNPPGCPKQNSMVALLCFSEQIRHVTVPRARAARERLNVVGNTASAPAVVSTPAVGSREDGSATVRKSQGEYIGAHVEMLELLVVAQCVDDASGWNTTSEIWEFKQ